MLVLRERIGGETNAPLCGESAHDLGDDFVLLAGLVMAWRYLRRTVKRNNAEDEDDRQGHDHNGVNLEPRGLISVQPCFTN